MASSGSFNTSAYNNLYLQFNWSVSSQSISGNYTVISWNIKCVRSSGSGGYYADYDAYINSTKVSYISSSSRQLMTNGKTVDSGTFTIYHAANGTASFSASIDAAIYTYARNCYGSGSWSLPTIPRYASISQSMASETETSITMSWSSDSTCDYLWYSTNNGSSWTAVGSINGSSGSYTISGLTPGTAYNVKTRVRRKDSQLTSDSSVLNISTYAYPNANSMPNFNIESNVVIGVYNPLGRSVTVALLNNADTVVASKTTTGTSATFTGAETKSALYSSIPNAKSGTYKVRVTYGSNVSTKTGGTYTATAALCAPTIGALSYADTNATAQAIIQNTSQIVQNVGKPLYTATGLAAKNNATLSSAKISVNGQNITLTISGSSASGGNAVINSGTNVTATLTLTDSRGFTSTKTVTVTMLEWTRPTAIITAERENNFYSETEINCDADYSSLSGKNSITIRYTAAAQPQTGQTTPATVSGTLQDNVPVTISLDNNFAWNLSITVTDAFGGTNTYTAVIARGIPIVFFDTKRRSVGINQFPLHNEALEIEGDIYTQGANATDVILECKNLLPYEAWKSVAIARGTAVWENNGVTLTATENTCSTVYGPGMPINARIPVEAGKTYVLTWEETTNANGSVGVYKNASYDVLAIVNNRNAKSLSFTVPSDVTFITYRFDVATSGVTIAYKNIMIRDASITDDSYVPYAMTNRQLTENTQDIADKIKSFYVVPFGVGSSYDSIRITFTDNGQKSMFLYGYTINNQTLGAISYYRGSDNLNFVTSIGAFNIQQKTDSVANSLIINTGRYGTGFLLVNAPCTVSNLNW